MSSEIISLRNAVDRLIDENAKLKTEVERLKKENAALKNDNAYLRNQLLNEAIRDISHGKW